MKKLLLLLSIVILGSCVEQATLNIECPCIITKVQAVNYDEIYLVRATKLDNENNYFEFETTYKYNIGDTIK